ncbi:hypothetical protein [Bradyrhizobium ottawaense]|uniref:Uncharacterized protein n=1 Tax=Bradyrhizobium ottawaense TaxID=931866 RepID=A0ABY0QHC6_9BRAD|nr:hypothetical protein [Bradyrhizobium ottawaense]SDK43758.1 hypothetical protein SAMN05444163_8110 [Bradyrhizobium ottawaense]
MKLYSIPSLTELLQELLHTKNFATVRSNTNRGVIEVWQFDTSGKVSQRFLIRVDNAPGEPL